jgi:hypothetical protein
MLSFTIFSFIHPSPFTIHHSPFTGPMPETIIQVENLSKYNHLGVVGTGTLSHDLNCACAKLRGKPDDGGAALLNRKDFKPKEFS